MPNEVRAGILYPVSGTALRGAWGLVGKSPVKRDNKDESARQYHFVSKTGRIWFV